MSGTVGRFTLPAGSKVDEKAIRAAVEGRELTFDGLDAVERAPAAAVWKFDVANAPT